ncbi:hypothetical protein CDLVIII_4026 [Clostridium sp. DL-VIII]|uniref:hypothetical protein n=1 Tax=Clostridium sp. DL-VIII TaxID=641107 RepID=UPI00023AF8EB|nr:hypothetical protein [Clostridium sp. DL-VIII]EHJ00564.1 hypothetical protein CDLVIII_4026 [Clostridium sp. DL-VIII]
MKRFIAILSIFLFLSLNSNIILAFAAPEAKSFTQGLYKVKDTELLTNISYNVRNTSPTGKAILIIFDSDELMQEFLRLEANSANYLLKPLTDGSIIIIIGGEL